jgi:hypothetical protein
MKILILAIYSNNEKYYTQMLEVQRRYVHKYENVDFYFVQSSFEHNEEVFIDNDIIYVRCKESYNTMLYKSIRAMGYLTNFLKKEYDFTIRTNISTLINIPKMIEILSPFQDKEYLYAGELVAIERVNILIRFVLGTAIILSKKLANKMIHERLKFNPTLEEDVSFGLFVQQHVPSAFDNTLTLLQRVFYTHTLSNGYNSNLNDFINFKENNNLDYIIVYRNKTGNRYNDVEMMRYICDNILLK